MGSVTRSGSLRFRYSLGGVAVLFVVIAAVGLVVLSSVAGSGVAGDKPLRAVAATRVSVFSLPSTSRPSWDDRNDAAYAPRAFEEDISSAGTFRSGLAVAAEDYLQCTAAHRALPSSKVGPKRASADSISLPLQFSVEYDAETCAGVVIIEGAFVSRDCNVGQTGGYPQFTRNFELRRFGESVMGPRWFEGALIGRVVHPLFFVFVNESCCYVSVFRLPTGFTDSGGSSEQAAVRDEYVVWLRQLYDKHEAINEMYEERALSYTMLPVKPSPSVRLVQNVDGLPVVSLPCQGGALSEKIHTESAPMWRSVAGERPQDHRHSALSGYWLWFKGAERNKYDKVPNFEPDILGRMNYGGVYEYVNVAVTAPYREQNHKRVCGSLQLDPSNVNTYVAAPHCPKICALEKLRNRRMYFFGDSHMRITFYGMMSRLGVSYPLNKVWRGDKTFYIASHNVTVSYIASYFLNMSRPSAAALLSDDSYPVVIAGVGQHHSTHCWTLRKHLHILNVSLAQLLHPAARQLLWLGIPAQPLNSHLYLPKPVGQARRDCRNNAKHILMNALQRRVVEQHSIPFLDLLRLSLGMAHTTLDGAHYYTWVRDAWLDAILGPL